MMRVVMSICSLFMGTIVSVLFFARGPIIGFISAIISWAILFAILFLLEKREKYSSVQENEKKWKSYVPKTTASAPLHPSLPASLSKTNGDDIRAKTDKELDQFMERIYVGGWLAGRMEGSPYEPPDFLPWLKSNCEEKNGPF